ncbi:tRNA (5-methylaminomethyl-2-thiouridine)(34)-methyltransferase MnmD [Lentimicrobium sp.]
MNTKIQIFITDDGSHTLMFPELQESYHSVHGAIQESEHVFIKNGLRETIIQKNNIHLLEVGFGSGLNALLTLREARDADVAVHYTALEPYPLPFELVAQLNYVQLVSNDLFHEFNQMHSLNNVSPVMLNLKFEFEKLRLRLQEFKSEENSFDLIYYDAFSPEKAPEMWDTSIFRQIYRILKPGGILVTYCAKGIVRRAMQQSGLKVERLDGPPGKRHVLRAVK